MKLIETTKLFFRDKNSYKKAPLVLIFFLEITYYLQILLKPVNQSKNLPIRLTCFTNVVEVIAFQINQNFSV